MSFSDFLQIAIGIMIGLALTIPAMIVAYTLLMILRYAAPVMVYFIMLITGLVEFSWYGVIAVALAQAGWMWLFGE